MKTLRFIGMALLAVVLSVSFSSCSDDDDDDGSSYSVNDVTGVWQCVSQTGDENEYKFIDGDHIKFFSDDYVGEEDVPEVTGKNCYINWIDGQARQGSQKYTLEELKNLPNPGEDNGTAYTVNGNVLTIMESDLDRWVGTIIIEGDVMTFSYTYQNWNADRKTMTEKFGPFTATFQKKQKYRQLLRKRYLCNTSINTVRFVCSA